MVRARMMAKPVADRSIIGRRIGLMALTRPPAESKAANAAINETISVRLGRRMPFHIRLPMA